MMPLDELRRALADYQRYARTESQGLGLAAAQQIVRAHGNGTPPLHDVKADLARSKVADELSQLLRTVSEKAEALGKAKRETDDFKRRAAELEQEVRSLREKASLSHLLARVNPEAQRRLIESPELRERFEQDSPVSAYVMSIDVRRSTSLMLKARDARLFAEFMIGLATRLQQIICSRYGVFDKFTGDGILAFFPEFFSGPDAGYRVLDAAAACHAAFREHYELNRRSFSVVLKDTGLGIGIDYGDVHVVFAGGQFTVVGKPVVYACRMGGGAPGSILVNQPAFEQLFDNYSAYSDFSEMEIDVKHEGPVCTYQVRMNGKTCPVAPPDWEVRARASDKNRPE
jgi:class 3 adenylate cyclase